MSVFYGEKWWLVIDDWWLIIDHGWLMIDNWWLMTGWWLMIDEWWLMVDDWWLMTYIIWNVRYSLPQGGSPPGANNMGPISYYICIYFIINHQSSLITHQSSVINHQSSIISYQSSIIHDQWSIISHQLLVIIFLWKNELPRRNVLGIGFMRCWLVEPKQKNEIFHCYNGSAGSSRGADGLYGEKTWPFWWSWGSSGNLEKSKLPGEVLKPKLQLYEPIGGRNTC